MSDRAATVLPLRGEGTPKGAEEVGTANPRISTIYHLQNPNIPHIPSIFRSYSTELSVNQM